jgi:NAD(P)H-hydrate epimerase
MKLVSVNEMQTAEKEAYESGLSYEEMMQNAGLGVSNVILHSFVNIEKQIITGLVGSGNNGGDTLIALSDLAHKGWQTHAFLLRPRPQKDITLKLFIDSGGTIYPTDDSTWIDAFERTVRQSSLILDGILGTGTKLPLRDDLRKTMAIIKQNILGLDERPYVIAVDCPSGIDCDLGEAAEETIPADLTISIAGVKLGLVRSPANLLCGQIKTIDIGIAEKSASWGKINNDVMDEKLVRSILPARPLDAHKGTFGTVLVIAGSINYTGAAMLAGKAAYRVGAGLVTLGVPIPLHNILAGHFPEATWVLLPHELGVISPEGASIIDQYLLKTTAMLFGPGVGQENSTRDFLSRLLTHQAKIRREKIGFVQENHPQSTSISSLPPTVIDADGLRLLAKIKDWPKYLPENTVLTPHPGEMSALSGLPVAEIQKNRIETAKKYADAWNCVVVLKGAYTIIANPKGNISIIPVATPALARAGTGDVLAGVVSGLLAQGIQAYDAARAGAWLHAQAGLLAEKSIGNSASVMAGDILSYLPSVLKPS